MRERLVHGLGRSGERPFLVAKVFEGGMPFSAKRSPYSGRPSQYQDVLNVGKS
jgi:hypothetical protein